MFECHYPVCAYAAGIKHCLQCVCLQGRSTPFRGGRAGADTGLMKGGGGGGGGGTIKRCRRQCIEVRSADQSARSVEIFFRLHISLPRMGSRGTFALCTASSRCTRIAGPRAAMSFFLAQILLTNVIRTYTEGYTRSWSRSQAVRFQATHGIERFHVTSSNFDFVAMATKIILQVAKVL